MKTETNLELARLDSNRLATIASESSTELWDYNSRGELQD